MFLQMNRLIRICSLKLKHSNLKFLQVLLIWVPYIIFKNTDDDEAVKVDSSADDGNTVIYVSREQNFIRSGPEVADEVIRK